MSRPGRGTAPGDAAAGHDHQPDRHRLEHLAGERLAGVARPGQQSRRIPRRRGPRPAHPSRGWSAESAIGSPGHRMRVAIRASAKVGPRLAGWCNLRRGLSTTRERQFVFLASRHDHISAPNTSTTPDRAPRRGRLPAGSGRPRSSTCRSTPAAVLGTWAAAALPMAALAWIVAPVLAGMLEGPSAWPRAILLCLTAGLDLAVRLRAPRRAPRAGLPPLVGGQGCPLAPAPRSPRTGRRGGRLWWILVPLVLAVAAKEALPKIRRRSTGTRACSCSRPPARSSSPGTGLVRGDRHHDDLQHRAR